MTAHIDDLLTAVSQEDVRAVDALLRAGTVGINDKDEDGRTPLMHAVLDSTADVDFIRLLIARGADVNIADVEQRWSARHFAPRSEARHRERTD